MARATIAWIIGYLVCMTIVVVTLSSARNSAILAFGTGEAQQHWDEWRNEAAKNSGESEPVAGPVQRRKPKSASPPAMVLMQDYFVICLSFALVMTSALFFTTMIAIRGIFSGTTPGGPES